MQIFIPDDLALTLADFLREHDYDTFFGVVDQIEGKAENIAKRGDKNDTGSGT